MIIGIIILLLIAIFLYIQFQSDLFPQELDKETKEVKVYIESCIEQKAREALNIIGINGGYIYFPEHIDINPFASLKLSPIEDLKNPYWWYGGISNIPTESFIKSQIVQYVENEFDSCFNKEDLKNYKIKELGTFRVKEVVLAKSDVILNVKFPIEVTYDEKTKKLTDFKVTIPIRLKQIYDLAKQIMETEDAQAFVEEKVIDLMAMDNDIPTTDVEFNCNQKMWEVPKVKAKLQKLVSTNLPYIRIKGTEINNNYWVPNPYEEVDTYETSYYNYHYIWEISEKDYKDMHVTFSYDPKWKMNFYVRPNDGLIMKSNAEKGQQMLSWFCMHIWHFSYDLIFPVKVTIADEDTKDHEAYAFNFAFKASINHNEPARYKFGTQSFKSAAGITDEEFCSDKTHEIDIYTWTNSSMRIDYLPGVNLTFTCGAFDCEVGKSAWLNYGAAAGFIGKFPYCVNGVLKAKRKGFEDTKMFIQTDKDGRWYNLYMTPIKEFKNFEVVKHPSANPLLPSRLLPDEKAVILLYMPDSYEIFSFGSYPIEEVPLPIKLYKEESIKYKVEIYLIKSSTNDEEGSDLIGGYKGTWDVNPDMLIGKEKITFHAVEQMPRAQNDQERFEFIANLEELSKELSEPELE